VIRNRRLSHAEGGENPTKNTVPPKRNRPQREGGTQKEKKKEGDRGLAKLPPSKNKLTRGEKKGGAFEAVEVKGQG